MTQFENIPQELRALPQWVNWKIEERKGKPTKVPYQPNGRHASSTDPRTWSPFERVSNSNGDLSGKIGFVFTKQARYVGIDFDKCREPETGKIEQRVLDAIKELNSYTEVSQSGTGFHVIVKGALPAGGNRRGRIEMYESGRFFCMTGDVLTDLGRKAIEERDLTRLHERMLAGEFKNCTRKKEIPLPDESAEDWRLIGEIQKQIRTSDPAALEEAFKEQYPDRYAERNRVKHGHHPNYVRYTIERFLERNGAGDDPAFVPRLPITETANAERLAESCGDEIRFCSDRKVWCAWDGSAWNVNDVGGVMRRVQEVCLSIYGEAARETNEKLRKALASWAMQSESRRTQENTAANARWFEGVEIRRFSDVFDTHPMLLNVKNGTLDLASGELRRHRREDYLTKVVPIEYDPQAECPRFKRFLDETLPRNGLVGYVTRFAGYCLTGSTSEQSWFMFCGVTASGKSTLIRILRGLLGPYALALPENYFLITKNTSDFATARLAGVRFATCIETNEGKRLDVAKIKSLTGQDVISAALKHQDFFDFQPQAKLVLATNHRPRVPDTDDSIWRRVKAVPFDVFVPEENRIPDLAEQLLDEEGPGILRLAVLGCQSWLAARRLDEPDAVKSTVAEYRAEEDTVQNFLNECCVIESDAQLVRRELFARFTAWLKENGVRQMTNVRFGRELVRLGVRGDKGNRLWLGIRLKDDADA